MQLGKQTTKIIWSSDWQAYDNYLKRYYRMQKIKSTLHKWNIALKSKAETFFILCAGAVGIFLAVLMIIWYWIKDTIQEKLT